MMKSFRDEGRKDDFPEISAEEEMSDKEKKGGFFRLTGCQPAGCFQLQFLDLFDQQGDVLQQVGVLLKQPLHSRLGISSSVHLHRQLLLKNADLSRMTRMLPFIPNMQRLS